jgi:hypothetical protein
MSLHLPLFQDQYCTAITACGRIRGDSISPKLLAKRRVMIASYAVPSGVAYMQILPTEKSSAHLHIDCVLASCFREGNVPKVTHKMSTLQNLLKHAVGLEIDVVVIGTFVLSLSELPEQGLIRSLFVEQKMGDIAVRLTGGTFSISGAPIKQVRWSIQGKDGKAHVEVRAETSKRIEENYLPSLVDWVNDQFSLFLLGRTKNA